MKCIACGSSALVTGLVFGRSGGETIVFQPDEVSKWKGMFGLGTRKVRAYGCVHCQHLQLAVEFSENDVRRHQEFEGEQPNVLERINSES
jgi:hypothetical protein